MKSREQLIFIVAGSISLAIIVLMSALLWMEMGKVKRTGNMAGSLSAQLRSIHARDPFPTRENVDKLEQNRASAANELGKFVQTLRRGQIRPEGDKTPLEWITQLVGMQANLRAIASDKFIHCANDFSFGFGYYDDGRPPARLDVTRLSLQLSIIERLIGILFESGIKEISLVGREEFEERTAGTHHKALVFSDPDPFEDRIYEPEKFHLEFAAPQAAFDAVLNRIASDEVFMIVTEVAIKGDEGAGRAEEEEISDAERYGLVPGSEDEFAEEKTHDEADRRERLVAGPGREKPADVRLALSVYQFLSPRDVLAATGIVIKVEEELVEE